MTAGRGIVHSEMPEQEQGLLEGFQLWINLPAANKMDAPGYQEHDASRIPLEQRDGARLKVITGTTSLGARGPVSQPLTEPLYLDVHIDAGAQFSEPIEAGHTAFVYVIDGEIELEDEQGSPRAVRRDQLAVLGSGSRITLQAAARPSRFLLVAGKPLHEPIARAGPFVMNTEAELRKAFADYQSGNF